MDPLFQVHKLNAEGMKAAGVLASQFANLSSFIDSLGAQGRCLSLARTHLEMACFYAKKSLAEKQENQEAHKAESVGVE